MRRRDSAEGIAEYILRERVGLSVIRVPTGTTETPEFKCDGDGRGYVVEVKTRFNSEEWDRAIRHGDAAFETRAIGWGRWTEDVARKAARQMTAVDPGHDRWWLLWLSVEVRPTPEGALKEVFGSLYGMRQAFLWNREGVAECHDCLYAARGVLERHPELSACVVHPGGPLPINIAVNEFAPDKESFEHSLLYRKGLENRALLTESSIMQRNDAWRCDLRENRGDDSVVASHLEQKYGVSGVRMLDMKEYSASMLVPAEPEERDRGEDQ